MSTDYLDTVLDEDKAVNEVVSDFIRTALTAFETKVDDIFLSTLDVPFATELAMLKIDKIIELALMEHDGNSTFEDEQLEVFIPDGEPMPSTIDSWARGTGAFFHTKPFDRGVMKFKISYSSLFSCCEESRARRAKDSSFVQQRNPQCLVQLHRAFVEHW